MTWREGVVVSGLGLSLACGTAPQGAAELDTRNEACQHCRMTVSDRRFASQVVAPGEEARFFDDLACLTEWLASQPTLPTGAVAYVTDHRTATWVAGSDAVFTRVETIETPMGSHVIAHASRASRDQDPEVREGVPVATADVLGAMARGEGRR